MTEENDSPLLDLLDKLEQAADTRTVRLGELVDRLGTHSFASVMLVASLLSTSPASAIPGLTSAVAVITFVLAAQIAVGKHSIWLPSFLNRRKIPSDALCKAVGWLRRPVGFVERFTKPRLRFLVHRPWLFLPLFLIMTLTLCMPFMEVIPTSGSIASAIIAVFAAGLLTRDGALIAASMILLLILPFIVWQSGVLA